MGKLGVDNCELSPFLTDFQAYSYLAKAYEEYLSPSKERRLLVEKKLRMMKTLEQTKKRIIHS